MQTILNQGKNFLEVDRRCLSIAGYDYTDGDVLLVKIQRENCQTRLFSAQTELCENRVLLSFSVQQCWDKRGRYLATILNQAKEELHKFFVQLHIKE